MKHDARAGLLLALCGFAILSVGDAILKSIEGEWTAIAAGALRYTIGAVALSAILLAKEGPAGFKPRNPWLQIGRGVSMGISTACFFSAIFVMPLAEATALVFIAPILTALLSKPLLGEHVRSAVWIASIIALVGVAMVLRPNLLTLGWQAVLPLGAALFFSLTVIANRASAGTGSAFSMQAYMAMFAAPVLVLFAAAGYFSGIEQLKFGWPPLDVIAKCTTVAVTASTAHYLVYLGTTKAGAATIAPMTYVQLLVAIILGWFVFGDAPDAMTLAGAAVIVAGGLYLWRDGRKLSSTQAR